MSLKRVTEILANYEWKVTIKMEVQISLIAL